MSDTSLVMECRYHFGNNPGLYAPAAYVGYTVSLPMRVVWVREAPDVTEATLVFLTQDIETWGEWKGHRVLINGEEVGRLKDPGDDDGRFERFRLRIPLERFRKIKEAGGTFLLSIELDRQHEHPWLSDDFLLRRLEAGEVAIRLGA